MSMNLLRIREAASLLGCHPYSLYAAIYEGRIKACKLRGGVRIREDEVERLIAKRERLEGNLSVNEVSRILSCSVSSVLRIIRSRKLRAELMGQSYRILANDLERYVLSLPKL